LISPSDWQRVKEAFHSAVELDVEERKSFLDEFRSAEPQLFRELESLLAHQQPTIQVFDEESLLTGLNQEEPVSWEGRKIGAYQVITKIGEGGMGTVFHAIRIDDHYLKNVAIKIVRAACATQPYLQRFRGERQILATLDHPHIAHLLDGGATEDGLPYLVMEHVSGVPIDEYCDQHNLSIPARLKLFLKVCSAVEYAHQKLVIHRDLKPANILVTAEGDPKLLDFGIAKLLDPELYFLTVDADGTNAWPMTPEYASPEQVRGEQITTASDVYSLGVVLYRLMTGHAPYVLPRTGLAQWSRVILETEPERPSVVIEKTAENSGPPGSKKSVSPEEIAAARGTRLPALRRSLRGDIDNIVLMALRKDSARRYSSVEQLANDIRRSLEGLPVAARPDTIGYRTAKFARRHRVLLAAAAIVVLSLTTGMVVAIRQARIAEQQRAVAEQRFNDIQAVSHDLIFQIHDSIQFLPGATPARKIVVQSALRYLNALSKEAPGNLSVQQEIASAYEKVGDVQGGIGSANLGDTAGALDSYNKALEIRKNIFALKPGDSEARDGLAQAYLRIGRIYMDMGRYDQALQIAQNHLNLSQQIVAEAPDNRRAKSRLAASYDGMGDTLSALGRWDECLKNYEASSEIYKALAASSPKPEIARSNWALERRKIGGVLEATGHTQRALAEYEEALKVDRELANADPVDSSRARDLAVDYTNLGDALLKTSDTNAAIQNYNQALAIDHRLMTADPSDASARFYLVFDSYRLGDALLKSAKVKEAVAEYKLAASLAEKNARSDPENAMLRSELARVYSKLARAQLSMAGDGALSGREKRAGLAAAQASYKKSLDIWLELQKKGAIESNDKHEPERVSEELKACQQQMESSS
jgi:eukaryotic-like serine/threonine-protein kinase